jgi:Cu(I)/Ag(I) efflux system periplasmic protein CusF
VRALVALIASLSIATPAALTSAYAADPHAGHHADAPAASAPATALSEGTVKKVDKAKGKLTIAHGPLANLQMSAMTMSFKVKDPAWLDSVKAGDRIDFLAEDVKGSLTVTKLVRK